MKLEIVSLIVLAANAAMSQSLRINELMYAPAGGEPEWIEFHNSSTDSVNLKEWKIRNKNGNLYLIASDDFYVPSDSFVVLTKSATIFSFHSSIPSRVLIDPALPATFLVNTGDTISVHDQTGAVVDSVFYLPSWGGSGGKSLERISVSLSPFLDTNWGTSQDPSGSTPGRINSIAAREYDLEMTSFSAASLIGEAKASFTINLKNSGTQRVSAYDLQVFIDYDLDHVPQQSELAASRHVDSGLNPGDSTRVILEAAFTETQTADAFAVIVFSADQDTTDNSMWAKARLSYPPRSAVVNEIMYAPATPETEWVELFNPSAYEVSLEGFTLSDNSGIKVLLTSSEHIIGPGRFVVIAHDSGFFKIHDLSSGDVLVAKIPSLNNSGDVVAIHDAAGNMIDSVNYLPSWGGNSGGKSLERILASGSSDDPQNFETCTDSSKSTPGRVNSVSPRDFDLAIGNVSWSPIAIQSGGSATIAANIVNAGLQPSGNAVAILFQDRNNDVLFTPGEECDSAEVTSLPPGDSVTVNLKTGTLSYGSHRFGLLLEFAGDERMSNNSKYITLKVGLPPATVVINELMYEPEPPEQEWLELYNTSDGAVDLSNFKIATHGGSVKIKTGSLLAPHDFAVLCKDSSVSRHHYSVKNLVIQSVPSMSNGGDAVALYDNLGNLLDTMNYSPSYGGNTGRSLERVDYLAGNDSTNWEESMDTTGATPGIQNSVAILPTDVALERLDLSAAARSPGESGTISMIVANHGRNAAANISAHIDILRSLDSGIVYSETQRLNGILAPKDSMAAQFHYSPDKSGLHVVSARISLENDPRFWNDTLSALMNVAYRMESVVINEIMYTNGSGGEYFEILNVSGDEIDLAGWEFHTSSSAPKLISGLTGKKPLAPDGYFVISSDSSMLGIVQDTGAVRISKSMSLRDDGDCVVIIDPSGNVVDSVYYLPSWHNGDIVRTAGRSLEKINPSLPSNEKTSWSTCVSQSGGTPGARNSLYVNSGQTSGAISVSPNPFSPDGDGHDDFTFMNYSFPVTSVKIRTRVFDSVGRLIATPVDNAVLPSTGKLVWDGRDGSGKIVRFGLYILFMEVTGPDGKSLATYKTPLVVAKKMR
jgi:Lamin Tail Domain